MKTTPRSPVAGGSALATLRRINSSPRPVIEGERCEMCAEAITEQHQHVVDCELRNLMCTCRGCYLLFSDPQAALRYKAVPDRYLTFTDFVFSRGDWEELAIPVGLVFLFFNSTQQRMVACYPSPAGATESELLLPAWERITRANPVLALLQPDVEALLIHSRDHGQSFDAHLVPIDACYELVGSMRLTWRGFDGGSEARVAMGEFFETVDARSRPAPARTAEPQPGPEPDPVPRPEQGSDRGSVR